MSRDPIEESRHTVRPGLSEGNRLYDIGQINAIRRVAVPYDSIRRKRSQIRDAEGSEGRHGIGSGIEQDIEVASWPRVSMKSHGVGTDDEVIDMAVIQAGKEPGSIIHEQ